jgi:periplasmic protein TonB
VHMLQDTPENHLAPLTSPLALTDAEKQRKRMLIALGILLAALVAVVLKDFDFWFPPDGEVQEAVVRNKNKNLSGSVLATPPAAAARERKSVKAPAAATETPKAPLSATAVRAALPPMQIEVVAGNRHMGVPAKSTAIHVDVNPGDTSPPSGAAPAMNAPVSSSERVQLSPQTTQSVSVSVPPNYPLLARQMKVQGAVSLQALISREGAIQELQILSGPSILASAAREAVRQWHFKPYLQNGQPVETQARITVNFTISTN